MLHEQQGEDRSARASFHAAVEMAKTERTCTELLVQLLLASGRCHLKEGNREIGEQLLVDAMKEAELCGDLAAGTVAAKVNVLQIPYRVVSLASGKLLWRVRCRRQDALSGGVFHPEIGEDDGGNHTRAE